MNEVPRSPTNSRTSEVERIIATAEVDTTFAGRKNIKYRGRRSTWPGALALILVAIGSAFAIVYFGLKTHNGVSHPNEDIADAQAKFNTGKVIVDGRDVNITAEDPAVVNPRTFEDKKCEQPNYVSKNGRLFAVFKSGEEVQLDIKGATWKGMEGKRAVPTGLWDGSREGSTLYRVGQFLKGNKFNVVRLTLAIDSARRNVKVDTTAINKYSQRALTAEYYNKFLGQIVQGLGQNDLGVVLDFDRLAAPPVVDNGEGDQLWYGETIRIDDIKAAITKLAEELCDSTHYNVIGIDLKDNIGKTASWADGSETDWAAAATTLGNHVLTACPKWVSFIQGIEGDSRRDSFEGRKDLKYKSFAGSDLTGVDKNPIKLTTPNKVVYSPKYWSSSFQPQPFFFDNDKFKESSNSTLQKNVETSMNLMFGAAIKSGAAVVLSSFGGLIGEADQTKMKTSSRIVDYVIGNMLKEKDGLAGGFFYALNPDTLYSYPVPDNGTVPIKTGLVDESWRDANMEVLASLKKMDAMAGLQNIPCVTA